ncbi:MAG: branched-chain amino acid ABC transporter permease [Bifidobacteriaceae bacterium]|jgi:branched-chain amino acid transport system permease protein|nr:branched-chain amino acid ABC transporter permease [Bifidobacteriaceae bacterium]
MNALQWLSRRSTPIILAAVLAVLVYFLWWLNDSYLEDVATNGCITLVMVMGFQLFMGNSGILNWSYVGYVGIGAFASAICSIEPDSKRLQMPVMYEALIGIHMPYWAALLVGAAVAALAAAIIGFPLARLSDMAGAIAQFALLVVFYTLLAQWQQVTNGPRTFTLGGTRSTTIWVALVVGVISIFVAYWFKESALGLRLRASREDRYAAASSGINVVATRYYGYIISAAVGGLAGGLFSHYILSITAKSFYLAELFLVLSMVIIGGSMSVTGAFAGCILITIARQGLRQGEANLTNSGFDVSGMTEIVLAVLMILFLMLRPNGIAAGWEVRWRLPGRRAARSDSKQRS